MRESQRKPRHNINPAISPWKKFYSTNIPLDLPPPTQSQDSLSVQQSPDVSLGFFDHLLDESQKIFGDRTFFGYFNVRSRKTLKTLKYQTKHQSDYVQE
jgi:hypothetical protein